MMSQNYNPHGIVTGFYHFNKPICFALSRHHGIINRLLDWTTDPRIAAFFSGYSTKAEMICVWAINTKAYGSAHSSIHYHKRLHKNGLEFLLKQQGLFTELFAADSYYYKHGFWPSVVDYLVEIYSALCSTPLEHTKYIKCIELPIREVPKMMALLNTLRINNVTLRPTYDNVAGYVNQSFL